MLQLPIPRSPILIALAIALFAAAPGSMAALPAAENASATVTVSNFDYTDADTGNAVSIINAGDSVTFVWASGTHSVTHGLSPSTDGLTPPPVAGTFDSGLKDTPSLPFVVSFPSTGVFAYYCTVHATMRGVVVVQ